MAKQKIKKIVEVEEEVNVDEGQEYVAIVSGMGMKRRADGRIDTVDYREAFVLTDLSAPLSHIVSFYLKPRLIEKYGRDVTGLYTHHLETVFPKDDPESIDGLPVRLMSFSQLATYCAQRGLRGFDEACFSDVIEARETVEAAGEGEHAYIKLLNFYRERTIKLNAHKAVLDRSASADDILAEYDSKRIDAKAKPKAKAEPRARVDAASTEPQTV